MPARRPSPADGAVYDPIARYYDLDHAGFEDDLAFYQQFARAWAGLVLDVGIGTGRVAVPLARAGYEVVGVDASAAMLAIARRRIDAEGLGDRVTLVQGEAGTFQAPADCGLALFTLNTFSHLLTGTEQLAALVNVRQHLLPGGRLLIDQWNPHASDAPDSSGQWIFGYRRQDARGHWVTQSVSSTADPAAQLLYTTIIYDEEVLLRRRRAASSATDRSRVVREVVSMRLRYFTRFEVEWLLLAAGYALEAVFGTYDLDAYSASAPRLIWLARKHEAE